MKLAIARPASYARWSTGGHAVGAGQGWGPANRLTWRDESDRSRARIAVESGAASSIRPRITCRDRQAGWAVSAPLGSVMMGGGEAIFGGGRCCNLGT